MKHRWVRSKKVREPRGFEPRRFHDDPNHPSQPINSQYVRSRTISAYTPVANPDLNRLSAHELRGHRRRLIRWLAACAIVVGILAFLLSQLTAQIGTISYEPAVIASPDRSAIKAAVNDYYASRPLERLRFLLNEKTLGQYLASKIPEIEGVQSISADGIGSSALALTMRTPVASWKIGDKTVYVDSTGQSFTNNYYATPSVDVVDESGAASTGSSAVASSSMIRYIGQLIAALKSNGAGTVTKVVLPAGMIRELDVYLQGRAYRVKVQLDRDVPSQAAEVKAALSYIDAHGGASQYVDVRVVGKAYYK